MALARLVMAFCAALPVLCTALTLRFGFAAVADLVAALLVMGCQCLPRARGKHQRENVMRAATTRGNCGQGKACGT
jgi:hypothetical protein